MWLPQKKLAFDCLITKKLVWVHTCWPVFVCTVCVAGVSDGYVHMWVCVCLSTKAYTYVGTE